MTRLSPFFDRPDALVSRKVGRFQEQCAQARLPALPADAPFAERLKAGRQWSGLSRNDGQFGGTHPRTLGDWERGDGLPPARKTRALTDILGLQRQERAAFFAARYAPQLAEAARPASWGRLLRAYRELAGLTRDDLGQRAGLLVSQLER